ncbi:MAG: S8 family serine peptidase, partial [Pseudomonadota bacterium]
MLLFHSAADQAARDAAVRAAGASHVQSLHVGDAHYALVQLPQGSNVPAMAARVSQLLNVDLAEPNLLYRMTNVPNDPLFPQQWGLNGTSGNLGSPDADIDALEAWPTFFGEKNVVIGVIDSGIDYGHPDLAPNLWNNPGEIADNGRDDDGNGFVDDVFGINTIDDNGDPLDTHGHGTHVSGIIAARGGNGIGVTGVMWDVSLASCKFMSDDGFGELFDALQCIEYFTSLKARGVPVVVTNNSWSGGGFSSGLRSAIQRAGQQDILFVTSAGNEGLDLDVSPRYPGSYVLDAIVTVAATSPSGGLSGFSNYGDETVDLGAPGEVILSTWVGGGYSNLSGTSMAAPFVAGVLGLMKSYSFLTPMDEIKAALLESSRRDPRLAPRINEGRRLRIDLPLFDRDLDGMPDRFEIQFNFDPENPADAVLDADNDGLSNREEYEQGTDPRDVDTDGDGLSDGDEVNVFQTDPGNVDTDGDNLSDGAEVNQFGTDPTVLDSDGDGLADGFEVSTTQTNPAESDSDGDGLGDGWEIEFSLDPTVFSDPDRDEDADGLGLLGEFLAGTRPDRADTDDDGLSDGAEVNGAGTDPLRVDTDNDSMPDGWEVSVGLDPLVDDAGLDSDRDGFFNLTEFRQGSDPLDSNSFPRLDAWANDGGDARRSGVVPLNSDDTAFAPVWTREFALDVEPGVVATTGQIVLSTRGESLGTDGVTVQKRRVESIDTATGDSLWFTDLDEFADLRRPSLNDTGLQVPVSAYGSGAASLVTLNLASGERTGVVARNGFALYEDVVADGDRVFLRDQTTLVAADSASGDRLWSVDLASIAGAGSVFNPVLYQDGVAVGLDSALYVYHRDDGRLLWSAQADACSEQSSDSTRASATRAGILVVVGEQCAAAYDLAQQVPLWARVGTRTRQLLAVDNEQVVFTENFTLRALDARTGELLWSQDGGANLGTSVVATLNHVFTVTPFGLRAFSREDGELVWSTPIAGDVAITPTGLLLVTDNEQSVHAFKVEGDTDGDGIDNWWERSYGLDVVSPEDAALDADGDGVTNLQEFETGLNPRDTDTDGDLIDDGTELNELGTDPLAPDTDGDGLSDGEERLIYNTDPLAADSDGDGLTDGDEIGLWNTDPLDNQSTPPGVERFYTSFETGLPALWRNPSDGAPGFRISGDRAVTGSFSLAAEPSATVAPTIAWTGFFNEGELTFDAIGAQDGCCAQFIVSVDDETTTLRMDGTWRSVSISIPAGFHIVRFSVLRPESAQYAHIDNVRFDRTVSFLASTRQIVVAQGETLTQYDQSGRISHFPLEIDAAGELRGIAVTNRGDIALYDAPRLHLVDPSTDTVQTVEVAGWQRSSQVGRAAIAALGDTLYAADYSDEGGLLRFDLDGQFRDRVLPGVSVFSLTPTGDGGLAVLAAGAGIGRFDPATQQISDSLALNPFPQVALRSRIDNAVFGTTLPNRLVRYSAAGNGLEDVTPTDFGSPSTLIETFNGTLLFGGQGTTAHIIEQDFSGYRSIALDFNLPSRSLYFAVIDGLGADADADGITDWWEMRNGLDPANPADGTDDRDSDGLSNRQEFELGSDLDRADTDDDGLSDGDEFLLYGSSLLSVDGDNDGLLDTEEALQLGTDPMSSDSDGDGLSDFEELRDFGTDPQAADTDDDGIDDRTELSFGLNPLQDDASTDTDGDGLTALDEVMAGTRPELADSDYDGLDDGRELNVLGTDPVFVDSDGDRILDGYEVAIGLDPLLATDAAEDIDGDGFDNVTEFYAATDPASAVSQPMPSPWAMARGGPTRRAFVPIQVDPVNLSALWSRALVTSVVEIKDLTSAGGQVFATLGSKAGWQALAINAYNGEVQWRHEFTQRGALGTEAIPYSNSLFVITNDSSPRLLQLNRFTGETLEASFDIDPVYRGFAPAFKNGFLYVGSQSGEIIKLDPLSKEVVWRSQGFSLPFSGGIMVDDASVYFPTYSGFRLPAGLTVLDDATGEIDYLVQGRADGLSPRFDEGLPLSDGGEGVFVRESDGRLSKVSSGPQRRTWTSIGVYDGEPAVANGVVYVTRPDGLAAFDTL